MKRKYRATRGKCVAFMGRIRKSSQVLIPQGDIKYLFEESTNELKKFAIRSPLTHEWIEFQISAQSILKSSYTEEINTLVDYYESMTRILELGRDIQPMKNDLTPWDEEECRLFGLRDPRKYARPYSPRS